MNAHPEIENRNEPAINPASESSAPAIPNSELTAPNPPAAPAAAGTAEVDIRHSEPVIDPASRSILADPSFQSAGVPQGSEPQAEARRAGHFIRTRGPVPKMALLPVDVREFVNEQLVHGTPPFIIVQSLEEKGYPGFNHTNISTWKLGGFQLWLRQKQSAAQQAQQRETALSYAQRTGCRLDDALYQVSLQNLFQAAAHLDSSELIQNAKDKIAFFFQVNQDAARLLKIGQGLKKSASNSFPIQNDRNRASDSFSSDGSGKGGLSIPQRDVADARLGIYPPDPEPATTEAKLGPTPSAATGEPSAPTA